MIASFRRYWKLHGTELLQLPLLMAGGFLFGQILLTVALRLEGPEEWFPISTLTAVILGMMGLFFFDSIGFSQNYRLALTMSRCRRPLIAAGFLTVLLHCLFLLLLAPFFALLDLLIGRLVCGGVLPEFAADFRRFATAPGLLLPVAVGLAFSVFFSAALLCRFGRRLAPFLYLFLLMAANLISPILDTVQNRPDGLIARIVLFLIGLPAALWAVIGLLLLLAMLYSSYRMLYTVRAEI